MVQRRRPTALGVGLKRVAVVGGGIVGLCSAYELVQRGFEVTVVSEDRVREDGCSWGNGGLIVPSHFVPLAAPGMVALGLQMLTRPSGPFGLSWPLDLSTIGWMARFARSCTAAHVSRCAPILAQMNLRSRECYDAMATVIGLEPPSRRGLLMLCETEQGVSAEVRLAERARELGLRARPVTHADVAALDPGVRYRVAGGVYFEDDAHLDATRWMRALRSWLSTRVKWVDGVATGLFAEGVLVADQMVHTDGIVLAAGVWSGELAESAGLNLPMRSGRGFGYTASSPPEMPSVPAILVEARVAMTPLFDAVRFVGTMELGAPVLVRDSPRVQGMKAAIERFMPAFHASMGGPVWCGLRPCSPDGMPYLGWTRRAPNLLVATGHAMMGMSLGPVTGKLVGQLLAHETPEIDLTLTNPDRYDG